MIRIPSESEVHREIKLEFSSVSFVLLHVVEVSSNAFYVDGGFRAVCVICNAIEHIVHAAFANASNCTLHYVLSIINVNMNSLL